MTLALNMLTIASNTIAKALVQSATDSKCRRITNAMMKSSGAQPTKTTGLARRVMMVTVWSMNPAKIATTVRVTANAVVWTNVSCAKADKSSTPHRTSAK